MAMDTTTAISAANPVSAQNAVPMANVAGTGQKQQQQNNEQRQASPEEISSAVEALKAYVEDSRLNLNISVDDASGRTVVKIIDARSNDVVRQIPSEEMLALSQRLRELTEAKGLLMAEKA